MGVDVDEAGCDQAPLGIDLAGRAAHDVGAHRSDVIAGDGHIGAVGGRACAVDHRAVADDDVVGTHSPSLPTSRLTPKDEP